MKLPKAVLFDFGDTITCVRREPTLTLLSVKALAISVEKSERDVRLIAKKINAIQHGKDGRFGPDYFVGSTHA
jgi:hypothetical protein